MDLFLDWLRGMGGLIFAVGTLLSGIAAIAAHISKNRAIPPEKRPGVRPVIRLALTVGIVLLAISGATFAVRAVAEQEEPVPLNVELTTAAWQSFENRAYEKAIVLADSCIAEFCGAAEIEQARLDSLAIPYPPVGKVTGEQKREILARGLLNDVATCFFIKGRSLERLDRAKDAREAYRSVIRYPHARCWDPKGWFWSLAEAADARLRQLK